MCLLTIDCCFQQVFCWVDELSLVFNPVMDQDAYRRMYAKILRECGHT